MNPTKSHTLFKSNQENMFQPIMTAKHEKYGIALYYTRSINILQFANFLAMYLHVIYLP